MNCIDLFCGAGGLSKGFENAGFSIIGAFDNWERASQCYNLNFSHGCELADLSDPSAFVNDLQIENIDAIIGGPPCQDFSSAGKRSEGKRAHLTLSFVEIVTAIMPKYFVMENVPAARKSATYGKAVKKLKEKKYGLTEVILDASFCGVPQKRKRLFCIGILNTKDGVLCGLLDRGQSYIETSVSDFFGPSISFEHYYIHPRSYTRRGVYSISEAAPTIRSTHRPMPKNYTFHDADSTRKKELVHNLTHSDRASIQTFPKGYKWSDSSSANNLLVGNAVPVKLSEYVAKCLKEHIDGDDCNDVMSFKEWLISVKKYNKIVAKDILSRYRRFEKILKEAKMSYDCSTDIDMISLRKSCKGFSDLSSSVFTQIKKAVALKTEFEDEQ